MSLRLSLILGIFALVMLTLCAGAAVVYVNAWQKVETEMTAAVEVGGRMMERAVTTIGPPFHSRDVLERLIANFDGDRHVQAVLIGPHGVVIAGSTPAEPDEPAPEWFQSLIDVPVKFRRIELPPAFEGSGALVLQSSPRNEISEVWEDAKKFFGTLGLLAAMILGLVYLHVTFALRPLRTLTQALGKVGDAKSRLLRVPVTGPSELAQVSSGFNDMLVRLEQAEAQNRRLNEQLAEVQEEERAELARDLHDEIGPLLFAVDVDAAAIERQATREGETQLSEKIGAVRDGIARLRGSVKQLLGRLRPAVLVDLGLPYAIGNLVAFWRGRHPEITIETDITAEDLGDKVNGVIYRIVQESLNNAVRHGRPDRIDVCIARAEGGQVEVKITDNGAGMDEDSENGFGISGMNDRVGALGGTLYVGASPSGRGVEVVANIPWSADDEGLAQTG